MSILFFVGGAFLVEDLMLKFVQYGHLKDTLPTHFRSHSSQYQELHVSHSIMFRESRKSSQQIMHRSRPSL